MATTTRNLIRKLQEEMAYMEINLRRKLEALENEGLLECLDTPNEITQHDITITLNINPEKSDDFHKIFRETFAGPHLGEAPYTVKANRLTFNINF